jgi:hypothetical protein
MPFLVRQLGQGQDAMAAAAAAARMLASSGAKTDRCGVDAMRLRRQSRTSPVLKVCEATWAFALN